MVTRKVPHGSHTRLLAVSLALASVVALTVIPSGVSAQSTAERAASAAAPVAAVTSPLAGLAAAPAATPVSVEMPAPAPPPSAGEIAVYVAMAQRGKPYRWAAEGPGAFDCSGLVMYAYAAAGRSLPHSSRSLRAMTANISEAELQPGDLVFGGSPVHHVGIYIGNGEMVNAPRTGDVVKVSPIHRRSGKVSFGRL